MADTATKTAVKWLYIIFGGLMVLSVAYILYNKMERPVAGVLIFIGGVLALYFYYVKWFIVPEAAPSWPPFKTPCPDYLTLITPGYETTGNNLTPISGPYKCVDFVGVSRNGRLLKADPKQLETQLQDPRYFFPINPSQSLDSLKTATANFGLTWTSLFGDN